VDDTWWRTNDRRFCALEALVTYVRAAAQHSGETVLVTCERIASRHEGQLGPTT
jgi:hypothetical protein